MKNISLDNNNCNIFIYLTYVQYSSIDNSDKCVLKLDLKEYHYSSTK